LSEEQVEVVGRVECKDDVDLAGMLERPEVSRPRPVSQGQGQGHRSKAKTKNAKVNFQINATVNPVFQF